jgi:hypothetical protein
MISLFLWLASLLHSLVPRIHVFTESCIVVFFAMDAFCGRILVFVRGIRIWVWDAGRARAMFGSGEQNNLISVFGSRRDRKDACILEDA